MRRRTNIYLDDEQLRLLRHMGADRGQPVAELVREAIGEWLERQGARPVGDDEWQRRFGALLARREQVTGALDLNEDQVEKDVLAAIREVRAARRR